MKLQQIMSKTRKALDDYSMIDEGDVAKVAKVAYVGDGTEDGISTLIKSEENTEVTAVNVVGDTPSAVNLRDFDVIVISGAVPATGAAADMRKLLRQIDTG